MKKISARFSALLNLMFLVHSIDFAEDYLLLNSK